MAVSTIATVPFSDVCSKRLMNRRIISPGVHSFKQIQHVGEDDGSISVFFGGEIIPWGTYDCGANMLESWGLRLTQAPSTLKIVSPANDIQLCIRESYVIGNSYDAQPVQTPRIGGHALQCNQHRLSRRPLRRPLLSLQHPNQTISGPHRTNNWLYHCSVPIQKRHSP